MTTGHIFFIPLVLLVGFVLGLMVGRKSVEAAIEEEKRLAKRRQMRRAAATEQTQTAVGESSEETA